MNAYGGEFSNTAQTLPLVVGTAVTVPMANAMAASNVTNTTANSLTLAQAGNYEISFFLNTSASVGAAVTVAVRANGTNIPSLVRTRLLSVGTEATISGSAVVTVTAGTVVDLAVSALLALSLTLGGGVNASLSVKKLN